MKNVLTVAFTVLLGATVAQPGGTLMPRRSPFT